MAIASIFAFLTQFLLTNQVATGLALTLFGLGFAAFAGREYTEVTIDLIKVQSIFQFCLKFRLLVHRFFRYESACLPCVFDGLYSLVVSYLRLNKV